MSNLNSWLNIPKKVTKVQVHLNEKCNLSIIPFLIYIKEIHNTIIQQEALENVLFQAFKENLQRFLKKVYWRVLRQLPPRKITPPPPTLTLKRTLTLTLTGGGGNFPWRQLSYNCSDARVKNCSMKRLFRSSIFATLESKFQKGKVGSQYLQTFFNIFFLVSFSNQSTCFILASRSSLLISEAYWGPCQHLWWSVFAKIVNTWKLVNYFLKKAPS